MKEVPAALMHLCVLLGVVPSHQKMRHRSLGAAVLEADHQKARVKQVLEMEQFDFLRKDSSFDRKSAQLFRGISNQ